MAECYEKLGDPEAQKVYARVARDFPDQADAAAEATSRLGLGVGPGARQTGGPATRQVWGGARGNENIADSVSADGRFLSYTDWFTGDLAIRDLGAGTNRRLTSNGSWTGQFAEFTVISPDGKQVAYAWSNQEGFYELRVIGVGGGPLRTLYRNAEVQYLQPFDWSPDQKQLLAVLIKQDRTNQLVIVSTNQGSVRVLKTLDWRGPWKMAFSPDGRHVVYDFPPNEEAPERDLFLLAIDGSREVPLVTHPAHDFLLGWMPQSDRVLFASTRTGANSAWAIRVTNGRPDGDAQLVKPAIGQVLPMKLPRAGDYFYAQGTGVRQSYTATLDPLTGKPLDGLTPLSGRFEEGKLAAIWSPEGRRLAYLVQSALVRGGEGANTLAFYTLQTGQTRTIPLKMSYAQRIQWQPDGRAMFVGGTDLKGRRGVFRVDVVSGSFEPIVYAAAGRFAIAPDGDTLFYEGRATQASRSATVALNLRTREERDVYSFSGSCGIALSPDGRWLAVKANLRGADGSVSPLPSIQIVPASGGEPRTVLTLEEPDSSQWRQMAWSADGKRVLFTKHHQELWQITAAGGVPERLAGGMTYINSISVHPGGRRLAVSAGAAKYETWAMSRLFPAERNIARR
jgi:Tol biopolymer transport system component